MPKLYYTTTSCGASSFMAAKAAGLKFEAEQVNLATHRTVVGDVDFYTINPKGNVPCLVLDNGIVINENIASLSFIGDMVRCVVISTCILTFSHFTLTLVFFTSLYC